jgi:hypothetical protein
MIDIHKCQEMRDGAHISEQIKLRRELMSSMVGRLYVSIVQDEIDVLEKMLYKIAEGEMHG